MSGKPGVSLAVCAFRHTFTDQVRSKKKPTGFNQWVFRLVHSEGFEPSTARFVAEYSIQLSYECIVGRIIGR